MNENVKPFNELPMGAVFKYPLLPDAVMRKVPQQRDEHNVVSNVVILDAPQNGLIPGHPLCLSGYDTVEYPIDAKEELRGREKALKHLLMLCDKLGLTIEEQPV